ncbi:MFS transporter [Chryseobacterium aquaticum]|uniref:MFS transporter n=1 Tax=Chryseobacterium aquaticum TaxID=452084 RepID=A0A848N2K6_9FLAO|nr:MULTISPECIES: MFS transporter [Chryseobacterium]KNB60428.1 MFS transporter [Chryseobacterium sp. Hurlbut01]NMR32771.1 MFS transporter [Chryseobacterium aquaticum]NRQ45299.1 MFS transporter [Chryseobacterium sp. C-204]
MSINSTNISLPLRLTFFIFSMVLNCMGIVILQLSQENIGYDKLGFLEAFKDLPIAFISLFAVNFISKVGAKKSLILALSIVGICSFILPFVEVFWFYKLWFAIIGTCFAIGKICVYGIIRNNITIEKSLAKTMNNVEASFMIGIFVVNVGFGWLIASEYSEYWKFGFMFISIVSLITIYLLSKITIIEADKNLENNILSSLISFRKTSVILFFFVIFFIVLTEQSFNSWLPTYYRNHLKVNSFFAIQASSMLAMFSYIGRIITANVIQRFSLVKYFTFCLVCIMFLLSIIFGIQYFGSDQSEISLYLFPIIGLFLSPLYPLINSKMISQIESQKINTFTSLIVIFSSLGSSVSSITMSLLFENQILTFYSLYILGAVLIIFCLSTFYFKQDYLKN